MYRPLQLASIVVIVIDHVEQITDHVFCQFARPSRHLPVEVYCTSHLEIVRKFRKLVLPGFLVTCFTRSLKTLDPGVDASTHLPDRTCRDCQAIILHLPSEIKETKNSNWQTYDRHNVGRERNVVGP